jgi:inner membrane protein
MASLTTHATVAALVTLPVIRSPRLRELMPGWMLALSVCILATICDLDTGAHRLLGIPPENILSHRALFHSPFFALAGSAILAAVVARGRGRQMFAWLWMLWAAAMMTHPLLDALTDGGRGLMLLLPFSRERMFFHWRPIHTPDPASARLVWRGLLGRASEGPFCLAAAAAGITGLLLRKAWAVAQRAAGRPQFGA